MVPGFCSVGKIIALLSQINNNNDKKMKFFFDKLNEKKNEEIIMVLALRTIYSIFFVLLKIDTIVFSMLLNKSVSNRFIKWSCAINYYHMLHKKWHLRLRNYLFYRTMPPASSQHLHSLYHRLAAFSPPSFYDELYLHVYDTCSTE